MKFRLIEENELEKRAKYHRKRQKGLSPFCYLNPNAGNVEKGIEVFNSSANTEAASLGEAIMDETHRFSYKGPIYKFLGDNKDRYRYVGETGETYYTVAPSKDKAKSNIQYQIKNDMNFEKFVNIKIDDTLIKQEPDIEIKDKISNEYDDGDYVGNVDGLDIYFVNGYYRVGDSNTEFMSIEELLDYYNG